MRRLSIALTTVPFLVACDIPGPEIHSRTGISDAPRSFVVQLGAEAAQLKLREGWTEQRQRDSEFYQEHGFRSADNPDQSEYLSANRIPPTCAGMDRGINLQVFPGSVGSNRYYTDSGPARYSANFAICITPADDELSRIAVVSSNARIYSGREFNGHALGYVPRAISVDPVIEEEWVVLRYSAHLLGVDLADPITIGDVSTQRGDR